MDLNAFLEHFHARDRVGEQMGFRVTDIGEGHSMVSLCISAANRNVMGALHGGVLAALTDTAAGCAIIYHGHMCVTLDASIRYLRGVREGMVYAKAQELHSGKQTAVVHVEVRDEQERLCCVCTTTMFLLDQPAVFPD